MFEREEVLLKIYDLNEEVMQKAGISDEDYAVAMDGWEVIPVYDKEEIIGGVLINGSEIHVDICRTPAGTARGMIRQTLNKIIDEYGFAETYIINTNKIAKRWCERLGFVEVMVYEDKNVSHLKCFKAKY